MTLAGLNYKNHFLSFENVCLTEVKQIGLIFQFKYYNFCHLEDFITEGLKWVIHKICDLEAANPFSSGCSKEKKKTFGAWNTSVHSLLWYKPGYFPKDFHWFLT